MIKVIINESNQTQIDWLVAKCLGKLDTVYYNDVNNFLVMYDRLGAFHFSDNWKLGGPIVDELINDGFTIQKADWGLGVKCFKVSGDTIQVSYGSTLMSAAMRCYVGQFYKTGEAEIPDELTQDDRLG